MLTFWLLVWYFIGLISGLMFHGIMKQEPKDIIYCVLLAPAMPIILLGVVCVVCSDKAEKLYAPK